MKRIGFLSFGHWRAAPGSQTRTASDALLQTIELAQAAEDLGVDGAFVRVHHFERQLASPFPLLAAIGARTSRIEIGTAVIDMRHENPLYMAEAAAAGPDQRRAAAARRQPGRKTVLRGAESFGWPADERRGRRPAQDRDLPGRYRRRGGRAHRPGGPGQRWPGHPAPSRAWPTGSGAPGPAPAQWAPRPG